MEPFGLMFRRAEPLSNGAVLDGRYRITHELGKGGMGTVYAAEHVVLRRKVAVKVLKHELLQSEEATTVSG